MPLLDSEAWDDVTADADSGRPAYVRVTDLEDGTARVQLDQCLPWSAVLQLLRALPSDDTMPS
jgi:hypothetical protein